MLTVGSLFAGIGGIELGLERTGGFKTVWQVERDEYARRVLAKHWPAVPRYRDVRYFLGSKRWRRCRAAWHTDVICGGFPCQDISSAGKRAGIEGARSGLWSEFARIVRLLQPRYVTVENVAAILGRGMGRVLGDLADMGFDAEWGVLPASAFGAPHIRPRVFVVAYAPRGCDANRPDGGDAKKQPVCPVAGAGGGVGRGDTAAGNRIVSRSAGVMEADGPDADGGRQQKQRERQPIFTRGEVGGDRIKCGDWWAVEPDVDRVAHGVPSRVDRLRCLGNSVVPQVSQWVGERILDYEQHLQEMRRRENSSQEG